MASRRARVLIVDDEPDMLAMFGLVLNVSNFELITATSAQEALEIIRDQQLDIVLSDLRMPGMSGLEMLGEIRRIAPHIVVIVATGYATGEVERECMRQGAFALIHKPFDLSLLRRTIERAREAMQVRSLDVAS